MKTMKTDEIEEMRSQISLLRSKLERQQIINESILTAAIHSNVAGIAWRMRMPLIAAVFALLYCPFALLYILHLSVPLIVFTEVMMLVALAGSVQMIRAMPTAADRGADMAEFVRRLDEFDRFRKRKLMGGMVLVAIFFAWFLKDISMNYSEEEFRFMTISLIIGLVLGLIIGFKNYFAISRRLNDLHRDAEVLRQK